MELPNEIELEKIKKSLEERSPNSSLTREKCIKQQKLLNHLIGVYKIKSKYHSPHSTTTTRKHLNYKSPLPFINKKCEPLSPSSVYINKNNDDINKTQELSAQSPTQIKKENQKEKLAYLKMLLVLKSSQKAKEEKNRMQVLNDNLKLYRNNLILEKITNRNVVLTRRKIIEDSIDNYRQMKRNYIELMNTNEIENLSKINKIKENEFTFWKRQAQSKLRKSYSMTSDLFLTQKQISPMSVNQY